jgi:hypothetical protein
VLVTRLLVWIDCWACILLVAVDNYKTCTVLNTLHVTPAHSVSSQSAVSSCARCIVAAFYDRDSLYYFRAHQLLLYRLATDCYWMTAVLSRAVICRWPSPTPSFLVLCHIEIIGIIFCLLLSLAFISIFTVGSGLVGTHNNIFLSHDCDLVVKLDSS